MSIKYPISFSFDKTGLSKANSSLKKFGANAAKIGAAAGAAIGGAAVFSIKKFADFDQALNQSIAIMGDVSDALRNDMANAAREVAKQTTFSAEEAAESFFFLASAGLDAEQSVAAMPQVAKFAQAGMFDMALATDLATDAQSALGLASDDSAENLENLTRVTDVFVKANTLANTSVEQLATAFTVKAGNALKTVGKDLEEGAAALAVFADQGIKGERAGTLLTNTIFGLTDIMAKAPAEAEALGIEIFNAAGEMNSFADISEDLTVALGDMTKEQQIATLDSLGFTKQAREGTLALLGNSDALREYEEELRNAGGTADEVATNQLDTFNAQMDLLKSRVEDAAIEIGTQLMPFVQDFTEDLGPLIDQNLPKLIELFEDTIENVETLAGEIQPHIDDILPDLKRMFEDLQEPVEDVIGFFTTLGEEVLLQVKKTIENPAFQNAVSSLGEGIGILATEAKRFVESEVGQFLLDLGSNAVIFGLDLLANTIKAVASQLERLNRAIEKFESGNILGGLGDLAGFFGLTPRNPFDSPLNDPRFIGRHGGSGSSAGEIPGFANGGVVTRPMFGMIGEAGRHEAVIPLDRYGNLTTGGGGNTFNINVNAGMGADGQRVGQQIVDEIIKFERTSGRVFARA